VSQARDKWRAFMNMVINLWVLQNFGKFLSSCATGSFSRRAQLHGVNTASIFRVKDESKSQTSKEQVRNMDGWMDGWMDG
jgi:hypothetical protein